MKLIIVLLFVIIISLVKSQSISLPNNGNCIYNGVDYSNLYNRSGYSAKNYGSLGNPSGKYTFYWNVCGNAPELCRSNNVSACQITPSISVIPTRIGEVLLGSFSNSPSGSTILTYNTTFKCSNTFRSFEIELICKNTPLEISLVTDSSQCNYRVKLTGLAACGNKTETTGTCTYNGIDYSNLRDDIGYSALSQAYNIFPVGKYKFYFNICGPALLCNSTLDSACKVQVGSSYAPIIVGNGFPGTFSNPVQNEVDLTYNTDTLPCSNDVYRSFDIKLVCGTGPLVISGVSENTRCSYSVTMSGLAACGNATQPKTTCKLSNDKLTINSTSPISCEGLGKTFCNITSDITCSTNKFYGEVTCTKSASLDSPSSISCNSNNVACESGTVQCSIDPKSSNLIVNNLIIHSKEFDSSQETKFITIPK